MKRFLLIILIALSFSSCVINKQYWVVMQITQGNCVLDSSNDGTPYVTAYMDEDIVCHYFLLPLTKEKTELTNIYYDDSLLALVAVDDETVTFRPLHTGYTKIRLVTKKHSSTTSNEIRIRH